MRKSAVDKRGERYNLLNFPPSFQNGNSSPAVRKRWAAEVRFEWARCLCYVGSGYYIKCQDEEKDECLELSIAFSA